MWEKIRLWILKKISPECLICNQKCEFEWCARRIPGSKDDYETGQFALCKNCKCDSCGKPIEFKLVKRPVFESRKKYKKVAIMFCCNCQKEIRKTLD